MPRSERTGPKSTGPKSNERPGKARTAARPGTGRVTPKGSGRYTPPTPREVKVSPRWVPVLMFSLLIVGMVVIIANYLEVLPGDAKNEYLFVGLGLITAGFITATKYR